MIFSLAVAPNLSSPHPHPSPPSPSTFSYPYPLLNPTANLTRSGRIWRAARQFWDALGLQDKDAMTMTEYRQMHLRISQVLAPGMSPACMEEACLEDWQGDLRGGEQMTFERYVSPPRCNPSNSTRGKVLMDTTRLPHNTYSWSLG